MGKPKKKRKRNSTQYLEEWWARVRDKPDFRVRNPTPYTPRAEWQTEPMYLLEQLIARVGRSDRCDWCNGPIFWVAQENLSETSIDWYGRNHMRDGRCPGYKAFQRVRLKKLINELREERLAYEAEKRPDGEGPLLEQGTREDWG